MYLLQRCFLHSYLLQSPSLASQYLSATAPAMIKSARYRRVTFNLSMVVRSSEISYRLFDTFGARDADRVCAHVFTEGSRTRRLRYRLSTECRNSGSELQLSVYRVSHPIMHKGFSDFFSEFLQLVGHY